MSYNDSIEEAIGEKGFPEMEYDSFREDLDMTDFSEMIFYGIT